MAFIHALETQQIVLTAQATAGGSSYGTAIFHPGRAVCQVDILNGSSTKIAYMAQGANGSSGIWFDLFAAPTSIGSTASARTCSTYTNLIFDRVRIQTTDAWTATTVASLTYTFHISAR
jgi:hypothetical protein